MYGSLGFLTCDQLGTLIILTRLTLMWYLRLAYMGQ
jgi:hypothetical protein